MAKKFNLRLPLCCTAFLQVLAWIRTQGEITVAKYMSVPLDCSNQIKDYDLEFEKFYFVSMVSPLTISVEDLFSLILMTVGDQCVEILLL